MTPPAPLFSILISTSAAWAVPAKAITTAAVANIVFRIVILQPRAGRLAGYRAALRAMRRLFVAPAQIQA
jgi:hypothetical protein